MCQEEEWQLAFGMTAGAEGAWDPGASASSICISFTARTMKTGLAVFNFLCHKRGREN
jgi:hypothetical protein